MQIGLENVNFIKKSDVQGVELCVGVSVCLQLNYLHSIRLKFQNIAHLSFCSLKFETI